MSNMHPVDWARIPPGVVDPDHRPWKQNVSDDTAPEGSAAGTGGAVDTETSPLLDLLSGFIVELRAAGLPVRIADLSTTTRHSGAEIPSHQIAAYHPRGASGVFVTDRGEAVAASPT